MVNQRLEELLELKSSLLKALVARRCDQRLLRELRNVHILLILELLRQLMKVIECFLKRAQPFGLLWSFSTFGFLLALCPLPLLQLDPEIVRLVLEIVVRHSDLENLLHIQRPRPIVWHLVLQQVRYPLLLMLLILLLLLIHPAALLVASLRFDFHSSTVHSRT